MGKLHAAAIAAGLLLFLVSGLQAATTIVATTGLGPIKSTDGGVTWSVIPVNVSNGILSGQPTLRVIGYDPTAPSTTWYAHGDAGGTYGFYRTTDGGLTWTGTPILNFIPAAIPGSIVVDPVATNVIYMIVYTSIVGKNYIAKSTDHGLTWNKVKLPSTVSYPAANNPDGTPSFWIATDPRQTGVLYAVGGHYVFKTIDFGATWTTLSTGVDTPEKNGLAAGAFPSLLRINVDPRVSTTLYVSAGASFVAPKCQGTPAGGQCGMYKSVDGGATWTQLGLQSYTSLGVSIDTVSGAMYAGGIISSGSGTVYRSTDGGTNWTPVKNGLDHATPRVLVDPNTPSTVYAQQNGSTNGFYYVSTDSGATWNPRPLPALCEVTKPNCSTAPTTNFSDLILVPGAASPPPPVTGPTRTISHIANGDGWRTTTILINTGTQLESFELKFWDENGNPLPLDLGADGVTADLIDAIQPGVARFIRTAGTGTLKPGWAELRSSLDIDGLSIFGLQSPGHGDSEAAVPLSPSGGTELFIPFDYSTGYSTGVAFADPGQQLANVTATILDDVGANVPAAGTIMVPDRGHYANVLAAKFPGVVGKRGVAHFTSTANIFGLGIRANGKAFTSIDALAGVTAATKTIPHIANGGGWKTTFLIVCADTHAANFTLKFWHDDGTPLPLPLVAAGIVTSITGTLQPGEIRIVETVNAGPLVTGWAELSGLTGGIGGTAIFALQSPVQADAEAAVPFSTAASTHLFMPYDYSPGYSTAIAFTNTGGTAAHVTATFTDDAGNDLGSGPSITVPAHGHNSAVLVLLKPAIAGTRGTVLFTSDVPVFGLGLRANGVAFTSLKVIAK
ncbi:MAG: hypothetical protein HYX25_04110 [Candidatus Solibacter usitatus]|nr:hypothetical protein [Candidatus Solibacter usitatus]